MQIGAERETIGNCIVEAFGKRDDVAGIHHGVLPPPRRSALFVENQSAKILELRRSDLFGSEIL